MRSESPATKSVQRDVVRPGASPDYLLCFLWFGLSVGLAEAVIQLLVALGQGHFLFVSDHFLWMTPVAEAAVYAVAGIPLLLLAAVFPRRKFLFIVTGTMAFLGTFTALASSGKLFWWASALLSVGIALRSAQAARAHPEGFLRLVHRTTPVLAAVVILCALGVFGRRAYLERAALRQLPEPPAGRPNVLLVILDTVRADALGNYSTSGADTPHLAEFGREGVLFEKALATSSWTLPSHASIFTGRYPNELSADWDAPLDGRHPTLAEVLASQGYATAGFVANLNYCSRPTGLARGFAHYEDSVLSLRELSRHSYWVSFLAKGQNGLTNFGIYDDLGRKSAKRITGDFTRWLDRRPRRPFFAFLNYLDAHDPFLPERLAGRSRPLTHEESLAMKAWRAADPRAISKAHRRLARACYHAAIEDLDVQIGRLLADLKQRGIRENTIVVIAADHGEHFGEHGVYYHGNSLYRAAVHVPLMISWPGRIPQRRIADPVSLRDLAATILDLTAAPDRHRLPGTSLRPAWRAGGSPAGVRSSRPFCTVNPHPCADVFPMQRYSPAAKGTMYSILDGNDYMIREGDATETLFEFAAATEAEEARAAGDDRRGRLEKASAALDRVLNGSVTPEISTQSAQSEDFAQPVSSRKTINTSPLARKKSPEYSANSSSARDQCGG